jgi:putative colanic acid biosynthesis acetyltransferase WcaF
MQQVRLDQYTITAYTPGASLAKQLLWFYIGSPLVQTSLLPFSGLKVALLRLFGATIGQGVRIKPQVKVKFPWRLTVGDYTWLGEGLWIDNLASVAIGDHVCLSQGVYLCTGNHDWSQPSFDLRLGEITIQTGSWIAAKAMLGPGVTVGEGAILSLGAVATQSLEPWTIYSGNPAQAVKKRALKP